MTAAERVLILGAGELGLSILRALSQHSPAQSASTSSHSPDVVKPTTIAVLVRAASLTTKPTLSDDLRALGADTIETADVVASSVSDLARIFARYDTIISCNGMGLPPGTQLKLLDAVLQSLTLAQKSGSTDDNNDKNMDEQKKKKRYFPWQFGMDYDAIGRGSAQDLFDEQLAVRERLRALQLPSVLDWTILSTGLFMSFLFRPDFGVVNIPARKVRALGSWETQITVTDVADIGVAVAEAVLGPPMSSAAEGGRVLYIAGDTLSYAQIADLVDKRFAGGTGEEEGGRGGKFERGLWDTRALEMQKEKDGATVMYKYRSTFAGGKGVAWDKQGTFGEERGLEMMSVERYLEAMGDDGQTKQ